MAFGPDTPFSSRSRPAAQRSALFLHIIVTVRLFLFDVLLLSGKVTRMTDAKTTRELGLTRRTGT